MASVFSRIINGELPCYKVAEDYLSLMAFAARVARGVEKAMDCIRVGYEVVGLDVHHVHVHLLPLSGPKDMDLSRAHLDLTGERMAEIAATIASHIEK